MNIKNNNRKKKEAFKTKSYLFSFISLFSFINSIQSSTNKWLFSFINSIQSFQI